MSGITSPPPRGTVSTASPVSASGLPLAEMVYTRSWRAGVRSPGVLNTLKQQIMSERSLLTPFLAQLFHFSSREPLKLLQRWRKVGCIRERREMCLFSLFTNLESNLGVTMEVPPRAQISTILPVAGVIKLFLLDLLKGNKHLLIEMTLNRCTGTCPR